MDYAWTVYVRDVFIILAAAALILVSLYLGLIGWQIYKLATELGTEVEPIVASLQSSASTVENTTSFLSGRFTTPAHAATNSLVGLMGLYQLYRQARQQPGAVAAGSAVPPPVSAAAGSEDTKG
jgi:hypothetical protein